ncbi:MAG: hypothetical protein MUC37_08495, partial [Hyphomicrobium sp.]|nr:hypothetical protein [Hyphomicrobium sp.]
RKPESAEASGIGLLAAEPQRSCQNGEPVNPIKAGEAPMDVTPAVRRQPVEAGSSGDGFVYGTTSPRLRDVGAEVRDPDNR